MDTVNANIDWNSGCAVKVISKKFYDKYLTHIMLSTFMVTLITYVKTKIFPVSVININICYNKL